MDWQGQKNVGTSRSVTCMGHKKEELKYNQLHSLLLLTTSLKKKKGKTKLEFPHKPLTIRLRNTQF